MAMHWAIRVEANELLLKWFDTSGWIIQSVAWPIATVCIVMLLRREIHGLLRRLRHGKWGDAELHFDQRMDELVAKTEVAEESSNAAVVSDEPKGEVQPQSENSQVAPSTSVDAPNARPAEPAEASTPESTAAPSKVPEVTPVVVTKGSERAIYFSKLYKGMQKVGNAWETAYEVPPHLAQLAVRSPRSAIRRAWGRLSKEIQEFAPHSLAVALDIIPGKVFSSLSSDDISRLIELKTLHDDLEKFPEEVPSLDSVLSYIELSEQLRLKMKRLRTRDNRGDDSNSSKG